MRTLTLAALVVGLAGRAGAARADSKKADPTGTWKWTVEFGERKFDQTLKLKLDDGKLTGTLSLGKLEAKIEDGTFKDGQVAFTVVRDRKGEKATTKYSGKLSGDTIKGTVESNFGGKSLKRDWEAKREAK